MSQLTMSDRKTLNKSLRIILEKKKVKQRLDKSGWSGVDYLEDPNHYRNTNGYSMQKLLEKAKGLFKTTMSPDKKKRGRKRFHSTKYGYGHHSGMAVNFQPRSVLKQKAIRKAEMEESKFYHE